MIYDTGKDESKREGEREREVGVRSSSSKYMNEIVVVSSSW